MKQYQIILITKNDNKDKYYIDAKDMDEAYNIASKDAHRKGYKIRCVSEVPASMTLF